MLHLPSNNEHDTNYIFVLSSRICARNIYHHNYIIISSSDETHDLYLLDFSERKLHIVILVVLGFPTIRTKKEIFDAISSFYNLFRGSYRQTFLSSFSEYLPNVLFACRRFSSMQARLCTSRWVRAT